VFTCVLVDQLILRVLTRDSSKADSPIGVKIAQGELLNIDALRSSFAL